MARKYGKCNYAVLKKTFWGWKKKLVKHAIKPEMSYWQDGDKSRIGINLCPNNTNKKMALLVFSPEPDEVIVHYPKRIKTWEQLAKWIGLFPSAGQARKAGFCGAIEAGFTARKIKSWHCWFWVYNTEM